MVVFAYRMTFGWDLLGFKNQSVGFFGGRKKNCWSRLPTYGRVIMFVGSSGSIVRGCACMHHARGDVFIGSCPCAKVTFDQIQ